MDTTLNVSHQRAVGDLLQAERDLRQKSEDTIRAMRQVLVETANRFDGKRLQEISRDNPAIPANWDALDWKSFFDEIPAPSNGWVKTVAPDTKAKRELLQQVADLQSALKQAELNLEDERAKIAAISSIQAETAMPVANADQKLAVSDVIENIPPDATPAMTVIVEDTKRMLANFPQKIPEAFSSVLSGGGRTGGDLVRVFQRYWLILYMIGRWRLTASMELEEALSGTVGVSAGSGSMRRVLLDLEEANILVPEILKLKSPRTALKLYRFSPEGEKLFQALYQSRPLEDDWSRLIRLHEGVRFPEHTLAVIAFTMHARKRGWATQVLPEVKETKSVPDAWIMRGDEKLYVEVELGEKESVTKWRNQAVLNGGNVALCAANQKTRARLSADCKLDHLPGLATDLETLIKGKFKKINSASPLWLTSWK
jgi:DNA-binding PadR family transcriptional regulator